MRSTASGPTTLELARLFGCYWHAQRKSLPLGASTGDGEARMARSLAVVAMLSMQLSAAWSMGLIAQSACWSRRKPALRGTL
jgi:hypothetical protein